MKFKKLFNDRIKIYRHRKIFRANRSHLKDLYNSCLENISSITSPIALISQIQRSGGSLLSQLFDGHPEIHAHPDELMIGYPKKYYWPKIDLNRKPEMWFEMLFEENVLKHFLNGYKKGARNKRVFPFIFLAPLQKKIFLKQINSIESINYRDIFDAYMTSYFGAWLNYQNDLGPKKYVTAFTPRLSMESESVESFFSVYPDGYLISSVRSPQNWFPSARQHFDKKNIYGDLEKAMEQWKLNARAILQNKRKYGNRVIVICFEDLICRTTAVMRRLSAILNIEFENILLTPTFNKSPISANTSFEIEKPGIMRSTLSRYKALSTKEVDRIDMLTHSDYKEVLKIALSFS